MLFCIYVHSSAFILHLITSGCLYSALDSIEVHLIALTEHFESKIKMERSPPTPYPVFIRIRHYPSKSDIISRYPSDGLRRVRCGGTYWGQHSLFALWKEARILTCKQSSPPHPFSEVSVPTVTWKLIINNLIKFPQLKSVLSILTEFTRRPELS